MKRLRTKNVSSESRSDAEIELGLGGAPPTEPGKTEGGRERRITIEGEVSLRNAEEWHKVFEEAAGDGRDVVVDVAAVSACDAAGLQLLCSFRKTAAQRGVGFRVAAMAPAFEEAAAALGMPLEELGVPQGAGTDTAVSAPGGAGRGV